MSLPPGQQRVLDEIGVQLRASEPRLESMFAIFTRLNLGEPRPRREELPLRRGMRALMSSASRDGRERSSPRTGQRRNWRSPMLALIACHIAAALAVVGLLIGLGVGSATCLVGRHRGPAASRAADAGCRTQAGSSTYWLGSK